MIHISGYSFTESLYLSESSAIYRGKRASDGLAVVCKLLNREYPSVINLSSFKREYQITAKLQGAGAVRVLGLEESDKTLALIMEDSGAVSLDRDTRLKQAGIGEKIAFAASAAESLSLIHRRGIIHKDVTPSNILVDPLLMRANFIDFGISVELSSENLAVSAKGALEGTLSYISPEQTGRLNSPVDYRSDLYSLGAALYWLFTGRPPFTGNDDLELIYAHIARLPEPLEEADPRIPGTISAIISKLLRKDKEERYQSAAGLVKDLLRCAREYDEKGSISDFTLGESDGYGIFSIPRKLYGRQEELSYLLETFDKISKGGSCLLLVSGEAGIGKTTLIQEIHKSIVTGKAFFVSGKFNALERNIPYGAILQAFQSLASELSVMPESFLEDLRMRVASVKSTLLELVPKLHTALGVSEPPPVLEPIAAQNRIRLALREFLTALAGEDRPLVIFLDDLQWCDPSTLELLKYLTGRNAVPHLLLAGAYRDNVVTEGHHLTALLREAGGDAAQTGTENSKSRILSINLRPLGLEPQNLMVAEALRRTPESTLALSRVLHGKTGGNPFYLTQALLSLHDKGAFSLDTAENHWNWDMAKIMEAEIGANVIDFLVDRLSELPFAAIHALKAAACIGDVFNVRILSIVCGSEIGELESSLWTAIEKEIIVPRSGDYRLLSLERLDIEAAGSGISFKFQHDRLRQALFSMSTEEEKRLFRSRVGAEMLKEYRSGESDEKLFETVNHLNAAASPGDGLDARIELAGLNKAAGDKAMKATAFQTAADFYETGLSCLPEEEWKAHQELRFRLLIGQAESASLSGDPEKAAGLLDQAGTLASDDLESASVSIIRSRILEFNGALYPAIDEIRKSLSRLGLTLPETPEDVQKGIGEGISRMMGGMARIPIESLPDLPRMSDQRKIMAMRLLAQAVPSSIQVDYPLYLVETLTMMNLTLADGLTYESCKAVADAGILAASMLGDYGMAYRLGKTAFSLIDRMKAEWQRPPVYFSFTYISHMRKHFRESLDYYDLSYRTGLEMGDMQHAMYALSHKFHLMVWSGTDLRDCERENRDAMAFLAESQGFVQLKLSEIIMQAVRKFQTTLGDPAENDWGKADAVLLDTFNQMKHMVLIVRFAQYNTFFNYVMGNSDEAARWNEMAEGIIFASGTDFPVADHYLMRALLHIDQLKAGTAAGDAMTKIEASIAILKKWADSCPENFEHKYLLSLAELSAFKREPLETILDLYRRASASIDPGGFQQMTALINELEGRFWLERGEETIGKIFLHEAHYHYGRWGAVRKAQLMEQTYPMQLAARSEQRETSGKKRGTVSSGSDISNEFLDISSITKSVQVISGEIKTEALLKTLIGIAMENAGAQKGCILLDHEDGKGLRVEAHKTLSSEEIELADSNLCSGAENICREIVDFVQRSKECVVLDRASSAGPFRDNAYIRVNNVKSLLCMPIMHRNNLSGVLYLENNLSEGVFTSSRLSVLEILAAQASISMEIARLYANLEEKVAERTRQLNEANKQLQELTLIDPLTQLNNRRYFLDYIVGIANRFAQKIKRCREGAENRGNTPLNSVIGIFLIDIDHFKEVNDVWGHAAGDSVLTAISRTLKSIIRADDFAVRWGGEEFLLILNSTDPAYLDTFARRALNAVSSLPIQISEGKIIKKTCSIGYVQFPFVGSAPVSLSIEQTIMLSDHAMYIAKREGRDRAVRFNWDEDIQGDIRPQDILANLSSNHELIGDCVNMASIINGQ